MRINENLQNDQKIYAILSPETSYEELKRTIRSIRLDEIEKKIYELLKEGISINRISKQLKISSTMLATHIQDIHNKLNI